MTFTLSEQTNADKVDAAVSERRWQLTSIEAWGRACPGSRRTCCRAGVGASCSVWISMGSFIRRTYGVVRAAARISPVRQGIRCLNTRRCSRAASSPIPNCASCCQRTRFRCSAASTKLRADCRQQCAGAWSARLSTAGWIRCDSGPSCVVSRYGAMCAGVSRQCGLRSTTTMRAGRRCAAVTWCGLIRCWASARRRSSRSCRPGAQPCAVWTEAGRDNPPYHGQREFAPIRRASSGDDMTRHRKPPALPSDETSSQLRARYPRRGHRGRHDSVSRAGDRTRRAAAAEPPLGAMAGSVGSRKRPQPQTVRRKRVVHPEQHRVVGFRRHGRERLSGCARSYPVASPSRGLCECCCGMGFNRGWQAWVRNRQKNRT